MSNEVAAVELDPKSAWQHSNEAAQLLVNVRSHLLKGAAKAKSPALSARLEAYVQIVDTIEFEVRRVLTRLEEEQP